MYNFILSSAKKLFPYIHSSLQPFCIFSGANHRSAQVLLLSVIPGHLIFLYTIHLMKSGHTTLTPIFMSVYLATAILQVSPRGLLMQVLSVLHSLLNILHKYSRAIFTIQSVILADMNTALKIVCIVKMILTPKQKIVRKTKTLQLLSALPELFTIFQIIVFVLWCTVEAKQRKKIYRTCIHQLGTSITPNKC